MEVLMTIFCMDIHAVCAQDIHAVGITHHPDTREQCLALIGQKAIPIPGIIHQPLSPGGKRAAAPEGRKAVVIAPITSTTKTTTKSDNNE